MEESQKEKSLLNSARYCHGAGTCGIGDQQLSVNVTRGGQNQNF
jgi:hypothetical protein